MKKSGKVSIYDHTDVINAAILNVLDAESKSTADSIRKRVFYNSHNEVLCVCLVTTSVDRLLYFGLQDDVTKYIHGQVSEIDYDHVYHDNVFQYTLYFKRGN